MTREEHQTSQGYMWRALFGEQQTTLALAVDAFALPFVS
jgi:hypothetical protein